MTNLNLTHIVAVLDRSGSMQSKVEATCAGYNDFIAEQRKIPDHTTYVTLAQFDHAYEMPYLGLHIDDVPPLRLEPRGSTALYDAIGKTITTAGRRLRELPEDERPASVVFIVMTDGWENASNEYTLPMIKKMITEQQDTYSWLFKFFGADVSALSVAGRMGIRSDDAMYYASTNSGLAFAAASNSATRYVGSVVAGSSYGQAVMDAAFTEDERDAAANAAPPKPKRK